MMPMRVLRDERFTNAILDACTNAEARIAEIISDFHAAVASRKLIPTERRVEQEMYV